MIELFSLILAKKCSYTLLDVIYGVKITSEPEKRTPISVYLTPKAAMALHDYDKGSGYGSLSRRIEETILAFDAVYKSTFEFGQISSKYGIKASLSPEKRAQLSLSFWLTCKKLATRLRV